MRNWPGRGRKRLNREWDTEPERGVGVGGGGGEWWWRRRQESNRRLGK